MNSGLVEKIANALLYEGYMLYPYRPSAVKNRQRWNFGVIYPQAYSLVHGSDNAWSMQTECVVLGNAVQLNTPIINVKVRFLHPLAKEVGRLLHPLSELPHDLEPEFRIVESLQVGDRVFQSWQEAVEREVITQEFQMIDLVTQPQRLEFAFPPIRVRELKPLRSSAGEVSGVMITRQQPIEGAVEVAAEHYGNQVFKITVRILNLMPVEEADKMSRDEALMRSFVSAHTILNVRGGEFVSLLDYRKQFQKIVTECHNVGTWPVLVGEEGERDTMLSSPIILYDYPQIAQESAGDLFDGTEIDEILMLRIMTLTEEEKEEIRHTDERTRLVLERTEAIPEEQMMKLHGAVRHLRPLKDSSARTLQEEMPMDRWDILEEKPRLQQVRIGEIDVKPGDRVRLRPRQNGTDIFDLALEGKTATIETIEQDFEERIYLAVTVDDDPAKEFGCQRMPAHRFFFSPEEIEPLRTFDDVEGSSQVKSNDIEGRDL